MIEQFQQEQPDPRQRLWQRLNQDGRYTKSFDDFKTQFSSPEKIDKLYSRLAEDKLYNKGREAFGQQFFPDVKTQTQPSQLDALKPTGTVQPKETEQSSVKSVDPSRYETKLNPDQENQFQMWLDQQHSAGKIGDGDYDFYKKNGYGYDYDFRAAFLNGENAAKNGHWSDIGKKPNHETFSTESKYNGADGHKGGTWDGDTFVPATVKKIEEVDPIEQSIKAVELGKKVKMVGVSGGTGGAAPNVVPDQEAIAESNRIKEQLKQQGYSDKDVDELARDFQDIPQRMYERQGFSKPELLQKRKDNPEGYQRELAAFKWQANLNDALATKLANHEIPQGEYDAVRYYLDTNLSSQNVPYAQKRRFNQQVLSYIDKYVDDKDLKNRLLNSVRSDRAYTYGTVEDKELKDDPRKQYLDDHQIRALQYLEDTAPKEARAYNALLVDPKKLDGNLLAKQGYEEKAKRLEELGIWLQRNAIQEQLNELQKFDHLENHLQNLSPQEIEQRYKLHNKDTELNEASQSLNIKYPSVVGHDADEMVQEIIGQQHGFVPHVLGKSGVAVGNTVQGIEDLVSEPFRNDESSKIHQLEAIGELNRDSNAFYLRKKNQPIQNYDIKISDKLHGLIDPIVNDKNLSWEEKYKKLYPVLVQNPTEWGKIPKKSSLNLSPSSLFYSVGDMAAELLPFMGLEAVTGGGATATMGRKLLSTFTSALATSFHDTYASAAKEGVANPYGYALRTTAINAAAMAGAGTPDAIRKMFSTKTAIGELVARMTDDEIMATLNKGAGTAIKNFAAGVGKGLGEGLKTGAKFEAFMGGAKVLNQAIDGKDIDPAQLGREALVGMLNFGLFSGIGGAFKGNHLSELNKDALFKASTQPEVFKEAAGQQFKSGTITKEAYDNIVQNIDLAAKVQKKVPFVDAKGDDLSVKERNELLLLKIKENKIKEDVAKDWPENIKMKLEGQLEDVRAEIQKVYKGELKESEQPKEAVVTPEEKVEPAKPSVILPQENKPVEGQKADIERRRQEELDSLPLLPFDLGENPELTKRHADRAAAEQKINAKYDAELAALEKQKNESPTTNKPIETETAQPTNEPVVETSQAAAETKGTIPGQEASEGEPKPKVGGDGGEPHKPTEAAADKSEGEWTHINKNDITAAEELVKKLPFGDSESWNNSVSKGLSKLAKEAKGGESLFEAVSRKVQGWVGSIKQEIKDEGKSTFNPNDEEIAQMAFHRATLNKKIADLEPELTSPIEAVREAAALVMDGYKSERELVDYVLHNTATTAGRSFNIRQMVSKLDAENSLQIKRMEVIRKQKGEPLSEKQEEEIRDVHDELERIQKEKEDVSKNKSSEAFEKAVQEEVTRRMKQQKANGGSKEKPKTDSEKRSRMADKLNRWADKLEGFGKADLPEGTEKQGLSIDVQKMVANAMRYVAEGIREGKSVSEMVKEAVKKFGQHIEAHVKDGLREVGLTDKEIEGVRDHTLNKIKKLADTEKSDRLTKSAVGQGLIRDLVNDHIDNGLRGKEVFEALKKDLQSIFPEINDQQIRDAYLKEGEYTLEKKAKLDQEKHDAKQELESIAKLETDLEDLKDLKGLRSRNFPSERERSEYEKELLEKKQKKLKEISDRRRQILEDNKNIETETNRQLSKVKRLTEKLDNLKQGIREAAKRTKKEDAPEIEGLKEQIRQADKELRAAESEVNRLKREAQKKKDQLGELEANIKRAESGYELIKTHKKKSDRQIDEEIEAKKKQLQATLNKAGLKLERGSKDERAQKQKVADLHNQRVDAIVKKIEERLSSGKLSAEEEAALQNAKKILQKSKVAEDSALDILSAVDKAERSVELARKELANFQKLADLKKEVTHSQIQMGRDKIDAEQQIVAARYKKTREKNIQELERRLDAGEYVERETPRLIEKDAEAIRLEIKERQTQAKLDAIGKQAQRAAMSKRQKVIDTIQSIYIMGLVGRLSTLAKVAVSAVTKQPLNTITSQTFGRLGGVIFPKIKEALRGEGAESWLKEKHRYMAHFAHIGKEGMLKMVQKGKIAEQKASENYLNARDKAEELKNQYGEDSKEYQTFLKTDFKKSEDAYKQALLNNVANSLYEWIGGSAWADAAEVFLHSSARLEQLLGHGERQEWKNFTRREKIMFVLSSSAATHGVLKNFSARAEFAAAFVSRLENKMKAGIDISSPEEILKTINESYVNFEMGKYQENNLVTQGFKSALEGLQRMGDKNPDYKAAADVMAGILKFKNPIVRTPLNIAKEAIVYYAFGVPVALAKYRKVLHDAKVSAKEFDIAAEQMQGYVREYINKLDSDRIDFIYRAFRKGGFGLGVMALAAMGGIQFGGFFNRDERRKKGEELGVGEVAIGGHTLSKLEAKIFTHTSAAVPALLWSNFQRVKEKNINEGKPLSDAYLDAAIKDIEAMQSMIPMLQETTNPLQGVTLPLVGPFLTEFAEYTDKDEDGNPIKRKPQGTMFEKALQSIEMRIPGLRQNVPVKYESGGSPSPHPKKPMRQQPKKPHKN